MVALTTFHQMSALKALNDAASVLRGGLQHAVDLSCWRPAHQSIPDHNVAGFSVVCVLQHVLQLAELHCSMQCGQPWCEYACVIAICDRALAILG